MRYKGEIFGCEWNERQSSEISIALFQLTLTNNALKIIYVFTEVASWWYDRNSQFQILLQVQDVHVNEDHIYIHTSATPFKWQAVSWPAVSCRQWQCRQFARAGRTFRLNRMSLKSKFLVRTFHLERRMSERSEVPVGTWCLSQQKVRLCVKFVNDDKFSPKGRGVEFKFHPKKQVSNS